MTKNTDFGKYDRFLSFIKKNPYPRFLDNCIKKDQKIYFLFQKVITILRSMF